MKFDYAQLQTCNDTLAVQLQKVIITLVNVIQLLPYSCVFSCQYLYMVFKHSSILTALAHLPKVEWSLQSISVCKVSSMNCTITQATHFS